MRKKIIDCIVELEWRMFTMVYNVDGPADCQSDKCTFEIMRRAQAAMWQDATLQSYLTDLEQVQADGINLMTEKYARMMAETFPAEYERLKDRLPAVASSARQLIEEIMILHNGWEDEVRQRFPKLRSQGRPVNSGYGIASAATYLRGELLTYSERTLRLCLQDSKHAQAAGINLVALNLLSMAQAYGAASLEQLEEML